MSTDMLPTQVLGGSLARSVSLVALFLLAPYSWALNPSQPASSYLQTTFTVADGLPSNVVKAIVQTANGFLWLGTDDGLSRFNGRRFRRNNERQATDLEIGLYQHTAKNIADPSSKRFAPH